MSEREWIAVVGSVNADVTVRVPVVPRAGETVEGTSAEIYPGGKGANQAVQAARLGSVVRLIGRAGNDVLGDLVVASLARSGVDVAPVARDEEWATGVASILVEDSGENRIVVVPQANGRLSPADVEKRREVVSGAALLLVQLEVPLPAVERAVEIAAASSVPVLLNPAPARALPRGLLRAVEWLVPNEHEAAALAGVPAGDPAGAARVLRDEGASCVVVTLGDAGALVLSPEGEEQAPALPVQEVVDTTAAGDAFCGALAAALVSGAALRDAVRFANAAGAVAATRPGAQPSLGDRAEIERAVDAIP